MSVATRKLIKLVKEADESMQPRIGGLAPTITKWWRETNPLYVVVDNTKVTK